MILPRVAFDPGKIAANAHVLVQRLGDRGITVTGVTKAVCGHPEAARAMLEGGVVGLADARLTNFVRMRRAGLACPFSMLRAPMIGEMDEIVKVCNASYNTEMDTIRKLGAAALARDRQHHVILTVEMGDGRDGIMPAALVDFVARVVATPGVTLGGIAANFACMGNVAPTAGDMAMLTRLADTVEAASGARMDLVSGGGSASLVWALGRGATGRINNLRLGEAILLGIDPVTGRAVDGLHRDAFSLVAEVIETRRKPATMPTAPEIWMRQPSATDTPRPRSILALGRQDTDVTGLTFPAGFRFIGATSDHTVLDTDEVTVPVGSEMTMGLTYSALARAMRTCHATSRTGVTGLGRHPRGCSAPR